MAQMPNQNREDRDDLLMKIARCHRLARETSDPLTVERSPALAAEYEQRLKTGQQK